jgi:NAD(P)-dependent dehydrogenase (short-subunit alcohol dehydrogenase family)
MVIAVESGDAAEICAALAGNGAILAVVSADRSTVDRDVAVAEAAGAVVIGFTADASDPAAWQRIAPHVEQRLGPIDVAVAIGSEPARRVVADALATDMAARSRGVIIEIGATVTTWAAPPGVRHRSILVDDGVPLRDVASSVLLCASDTIRSSSLTVTLGQSAT